MNARAIDIPEPAELKTLDAGQLAALAAEVRRRIAQTVAHTGGHLASNLGVVELTLALHCVLEMPPDRLVWDVGHQCYAHKLLTGRADRFDTLRQAGGITGFPNPDESPYDLFHTGHVGSAISTALGLALGDQAAGRDNMAERAQAEAERLLAAHEVPPLTVEQERELDEILQEAECALASG